MKVFWEKTNNAFRARGEITVLEQLNECVLCCLYFHASILGLTTLRDTALCQPQVVRNLPFIYKPTYL